MGLTVTDMGLKKEAEAPELKKHAATIHCSNSLSLLQRKISNALLYHAYKELMLKEEHEISVKQLCKLIAYNGNNHSAIKEALKGLLSTVIEWNLVNDVTGVEDWSASSILASVSLKGPICLYAYSPRMKQLLHSPTMFGKINLFIQSRFNSSYGLALYENCIRYRGLPHTKWFDLDLFRKIMGVPDGKYSIFRDFKRRVLDKSVEEVNTYSDLIVEPELAREGRQVLKIRFLLKERAKKVRLGNVTGENKKESEMNDAVIEEDLKSKLMTQYGLIADQAEQVLQEYDRDFITEKIDVIESSKNYQTGKVQNLAAYFMSALKNNYQPAKSVEEQLRAERQRENLVHANSEKNKRKVEQIKEEYSTYREQTIDQAIEQLAEDEKTLFLSRFYEYAASSINTVFKLQRNKYTRETVLQSPQIKALFRQFALQELSVLKDQLLSFELFVEKLPEEKQQNFPL